MAISPFDSSIYGGLLSDDTLASLFSDEHEIRALLNVEAALAKAQGTLGIIPKNGADRIVASAKDLRVEPASLKTGTASAGVPITSLVAQLRKAAGDAGVYVHWGATSQDIVDTALVLRLKEAIGTIETRLVLLMRTLMAQAQEHRSSVMAGRTRFQQAVPTSYGLKVAGWLSGLCRHKARLQEMKPRLFVVQLGGAAGTLASFGTHGVTLTGAFAGELGLGVPPLPWHTQRDTFAELASWLSLLTGTLGKIGKDILLLAQSEVAEVRPGSGGGSSTMPQKANPIAAEILVTLAQMNAGLLGTFHGAVSQEHERGGAGWTAEWLTLPQMLLMAGSGLAKANDLMANLTIDTARMRANLAQTNGLIMAEAAVFALAAQMPRPKAEALVSEACLKVAAGQGHLADILTETAGVPLDAAALRDPASYLGAADALIDQTLAEAERLSSAD